MTTAHHPQQRRWLGLCVLTAAAGLGACAVAGWNRPDLLWRAYLVGLLPCWLMTIGAAGLLALGNLTGGRWATAARPFYMSAMRLLPLMVLLFLPITFGLEHVYPWARASGDAVEFSPAKAAYLSENFFLARGAGYLAVWLLVAWWLMSVSCNDLPPASTPAMRRAGALGLVLLVPTTTFAAFDWAMSLEPHWYSSIYGAILTAGGVIAAHAAALIGFAASSAPGTNEHDQGSCDVYNDLGNLMLAFVMVWTYFSFSQFLIIWSANLPSEIAWYQRRLSNGWQFVAMLLVLLCFAMPFLSLLARDRKRDIRRLAKVALLVLASFGLNMYWTIVPAFSPAEVTDHVAFGGALIGAGGLWLALYAFQIGRIDDTRPGNFT
jgi:hypothetical protein